MPETQPATIADAIRDRRSHVGADVTYIGSDTNRQPVGRFLSVAGAVVAVNIHTKFSQRRVGYAEQEQTVQFSAVAECSGLGCVEPRHEVTGRETFPLAADADETGKAPFLLTGDALKWAQSHAETCRAMPRPTA
ncbi:hypothetical protein ABZY81_23855 [Streptomyces sp. NPDC006514]|uniref:hypothetical protein n=1 Tax=Streptomyces sp. NPDC006514 TaxID=3154308 RepID=UPI0033AB52FD